MNDLEEKYEALALNIEALNEQYPRCDTANLNELKELHSLALKLSYKIKHIIELEKKAQGAL